MTNREMNLRVFEAKEIPHALFQPRLERGRSTAVHGGPRVETEDRK
jgi:hypothetical protein